ncbi:hypothetical protein [Pseudalkalibacillus caeni]|uniref:hypothetical protein n=1 Tax=Exobacillus caeni TaxID=2574798 RepID=UPI0014858E71|nr:hypothetical protein [Pseudalkalibacillus caeni]
MVFFETKLRRKAFDKLSIPEEVSTENNWIFNYSIALLGILVVIAEKTFLL